MNELAFTFVHGKSIVKSFMVQKLNIAPLQKELEKNSESTDVG